MHPLNRNHSLLERDREEIEQEHDGSAGGAPPLLSSFIVWRAVLLTLVVIGVAHSFLTPNHNFLTEMYFYRQDLIVATIELLLFTMLSRLSPQRVCLTYPPIEWRTVLLIAMAVAIFAWVGTFLICDNFAQSMDEYLARFDAQILATGRLAAPVPPQWRGYVPALQMLYLLPVAGHAWWISNYLPVNAAFLALASKLGVESLMPPIWAAIAIVATYAVGRRLWPGRPVVAMAAVVLLATSPQFLITAMTTFAMSPHLALNMVWLWLFLRGGKVGHTAAAAVAFLATGLHQIIFHPLFAAPFVLELWLAKRWKPAVWHTCAYAVIGLFWAMYQPMLLHHLGAEAIATAAPGPISTLRLLLSGFDPMGVGSVSKNLVRFFTWQSLLAIPLALTAIMPALRAGGAPRAMVFGILLTLGATIVLMPIQGHGYGYRYLHGMIGSVCLLAGWRLATLAEACTAVEARALQTLFMAAAVLTVVLLLPLGAFEAHRGEHPYALAVRQIQATDADIVLVDGRGVAFAVDLVRNDPFLRSRPLVLDRSSLTEAQLANLCRFTVRTFRPDQAAALGVPHVRDLPHDQGGLNCPSRIRKDQIARAR